jgi:long-chain acyl-CoA synthetase
VSARTGLTAPLILDPGLPFRRRRRKYRRPLNLASVLDRHPDDDVALLSRGRTTTYQALREQVAGLRAGFVGLGLQPGDRVGILCGTNWYFVAAYFSALGAGLVAVPLNPASPARELENELGEVGARAVVVAPAGFSSLSRLDRSRLPALEFCIVTDNVDIPRGVLLDDLLATEPSVPALERDDDDLAVLMFTSGTAGFPKAAMLTHGNLRSNIEQMQANEARAQTAADVSLGVLPLSHIFGLNVVLGVSLYAGSRILLIERFDPTSALEAVRRHGVTILPGAPGMWTAWASLADEADDAFASVRIAASGAAKLPLEVGETFKRRFGVVITEGYGLTEASPVVTTSVGGQEKPGSIGAPLPGVRVRLVDDEGDDVLVGDPGEIWVAGPNVFKGYWNDEEATAAALTEDGWLRTGDVAVVDDDGQLFLVDRVKDLIIVSGFNVFPAEVESVLLEHPAIQACGVIGVSHPYTGEAVKAYVVVAPGRSVEEDELIAFCAERLARYKCPEKIMFVDEIPLGSTGKVLRRTLT